MFKVDPTGTGSQKEIHLRRAHLSLYIINSPASSIRIGSIVGLIHFLNAAINLIFHLNQNKEFSPLIILVKRTFVKAPAKISKWHVWQVARYLCKFVRKKFFSLPVSTEIQVKIQTYYVTQIKSIPREDCVQDGRLTIYSRGRKELNPETDIVNNKWTAFLFKWTFSGLDLLIFLS